MAKNNSTALTLTLLITVSLLIIAGGVIWLVIHSKGQNPEVTPVRKTEQINPPNNPSVPEPAVNPGERKVDYSKLQEYLQQKDWLKADRETYERLLEAAGPKSQAKGFTDKDEMKTFSCNDLRTVDKLWSESTQGKQGFSVQQNFLKALGNYKKMYAQVGWEKLSGQPLIEWSYNGQTRRMESVPGKEPNYKNPPPGHLPTVEREYNFEVSINESLNKCGF